MFSPQVFGEEVICKDSMSSHPYPVNEESFTKANYELAIKSLNIAKEAEAYDWDFYDVESDLMYIKGYMYKLHINQRPTNTIIQKEFCEFLVVEAYQRHE
jgi:hypothetical protein